jgi:hypothetical protein
MFGLAASREATELVMDGVRESGSVRAGDAFTDSVTTIRRMGSDNASLTSFGAHFLPSSGPDGFLITRKMRLATRRGKSRALPRCVPFLVAFAALLLASWGMDTARVVED